MAKQHSKNAEPTDQDGDYAKFNFRLNLANPKEKAIWDFLQSHASSREASRVAKQMLYEGFTGRSWLTDRPLQPTASTFAVPQITAQSAAQPLYIEEDLADVEAGLEEWWNQSET